jgi:hypothetical protein
MRPARISKNYFENIQQRNKTTIGVFGPGPCPCRLSLNKDFLTAKGKF